MIRIENLLKTYASRAVLNNVSYDFTQSKTHVLLGTSGSGKTTLLRVILGLIKPDIGQVWIGSRHMTPETRQKLTREMGYVVQDGALFPHLNCRQNVTLVPNTLGWSAQQMTDRVRELCRLTNLEESLLDRYPRELSGGQRQRVGLMRALMLNPEILLLDEPLGALDPLVRAELQQQLKQLFKALNKTVLLVTHDLAEAAYLGDNILLMNDGKIAQSGTFAQLLHQPKTSFVRDFIRAQQSLVSDLLSERAPVSGLDRNVA